MAYQAVANCMDKPECPPQAGGWTCVVFHDQNLQWKVHAMRGSRAERNLEVRHITRLSQDDVRNFNIGRYR